MVFHERKWWKDGVVYQILPTSFKDTNNDGIGDIPGIISKLDYLNDLGVDILWVSPMYQTPMVDMGYDISDYENVHAPFGTLEDMETLIKEAHARGIRILLDLVINHSSDQHEWFKESRSSKDNPKRDWYMWRPARYDENGNRMAPNNWRSNFSQPAWTWDEHTQEYYLHLFCPEQPDFNWENPETRKALYKTAMDFWLQKGVDGFRVDTVNMYSKGEMKDAPVTDPSRFDQPAGEMYCNGPRMHEFLREMHSLCFSNYDEVYTVGELPGTKDPKKVLDYVSYSDRQLSTIFGFDIVDLGTGSYHGKAKFEYTDWHLSEFKQLWTNFNQFTSGTDGWGTAFLENHDQGRSVTRFGSDAPEWRVISAKMLATLLSTATGTVFVYQGQELGLINAPLDTPLSEYKDIDNLNYQKSKKEEIEKNPAALEHMKKSLHILARDHARLPIPWDASPNAGFTGKDAKPWMMIDPNYADHNVASQINNPESVLNYWKLMLKLRKEYPFHFIYGEFELLDGANEKTFVFVKRKEQSKDGDKVALVALNFTSEEQAWSPPSYASQAKSTFLVGNYGGSPRVDEKLQPWESRIYFVQ